MDLTSLLCINLIVAAESTQVFMTADWSWVGREEGGTMRKSQNLLLRAVISETLRLSLKNTDILHCLLTLVYGEHTVK